MCIGTHARCDRMRCFCFSEASVNCLLRVFLLSKAVLPIPQEHRLPEKNSFPALVYV